MSIFSAIFSRKKKAKKNYVVSVVLTEYFMGVTLFERTQSELVFVDSRLKDMEKEDFNKVSEIAEDIITPLEKNLDTILSDTLFVIPSFAISENDGKVAQPFRGAIRQLIKDFELNALGYVDLFEVVRIDAKSNDHWLFLERGMQSANLVLCGNDDVKKRLKVTSYADEICAHIEESVTKKVKIIYYSPIKHEDELTFERNLVGYSFVQITNEDIIKNIRLLLSEQFYGEQIKITENSTYKGEVASASVVESDIQTDEAVQQDDENLIVEHNAERIPEPVIKNAEITDGKNLSATAAVIPTVSSTQTVLAPDLQTGDVVPPQKNADFDDFVVYDGTSKENVVIAKSEKIEEKKQADIKSEKHAEQAAKIPVHEKEENIEYVHFDPKVDEQKTNVATESEQDVVKNAAGRSPIEIIVSLFVSWIMPIAFAAALALFIGSLIFFHKAEATLVVKTKNFSTDIILNDFVLKALDLEKDIEATIESSGTKEIGERSKGQVIIASFDDKVASFSAGTKLAAGDKIFRLDADVTLDASTVDTAQGTKVASKKTVKASSTFIGPEGNIDKGVDMTVNDNPKSLYYAVSESAFSGGSKQTVPAVSQDDIDDLDAKLQSLTELASKDAEMSNLKENEIVIRDLSETTLDDVEYSAAVGDAKTEVSATGVAKYTIYYGENSELIKSISSVVKSKVGKEYVFDQKQIEFETKKATLKSGGKSADLNLEVAVNVYLPPARETIKKSMVMVPVKSLDSKIAEPNNLSNIRVNIEPAFIPYQWFMPLFSDNINIKVISDGGL